jgi:hypothetical protein
MACKPALIANAKSLSGCFINVLSYIANAESLSGCFINVLLLEIKFSEPLDLHDHLAGRWHSASPFLPVSHKRGLKGDANRSVFSRKPECKARACAGA